MLSLLLSGLVASGNLAAQATSTIPNEHPSVYKGVRPLGMGNAFIAMPGSDENAPFYNPAAINDYEKKLHFRILSPTFDISTSVIGFVKDVLDLADNVNAEATDAGKIGVFRTFVDNHIGEFQSVAVRLPVLQVQHKWFSVSALADSRTTFSLRNRSFINTEVNSRSDFGGTIGGAYGFFDERLQAGINLKIIHRLSINQVITTDDIINTADFGDILPRLRATGVGFDLGLKGKIPTLFGWKWMDLLKPTAGFTWQDVGNTRFGNNVQDTNQSVSLGLGVHPTWGKWQFHLENDFRELNQSTSFLRKWNIGAEAVAPKLWGFFQPSVRIGGNQGYFTAGTSLDMRFAKLEFATYGEEGSQFTSQKQIRRIAVNMSFGF